MSFYYFSLFGAFFAFAISCLGLGVFWVVWTKVLRRKRSNRVFFVAALIALLLPWTEEFWIAYNFGQLCRKDAGVHINKVVEVDGFYDDTTHWWRQLKESSNYQFVESRDNLYGTLWRVERDGEGLRHFAIDKPTARYHYRVIDSHKKTVHKITRFENVVLDSSNGEILGRYVDYYRGPYWQFVGLDSTTIPCMEAQSDIRKYGTLSVYSLTLKSTQVRP